MPEPLDLTQVGDDVVAEWLHNPSFVKYRVEEISRGVLAEVSATPEDQLFPFQAITASGYQDPNGPWNLLDNNLGTRWSANPTHGHADGSGDVWAAGDLGQAVTFSAVDIAWYEGDIRKSVFDIQVSTGDDTGPWTTIFSGQSSGQSLEHERYHFQQVNARYVRLVCHGNIRNSDGSHNNWNSVTEFAGVLSTTEEPTLGKPIASASPGDAQVTVEAQQGPGAIPSSWTVRGSSIEGNNHPTLVGPVAAPFPFVDQPLPNDEPRYYVVDAHLGLQTRTSDEVTATPRIIVPISQIAMFTTSDELSMRQDRKANGPFKTKGDFSTNSPPHWEEMASKLSLNFSSARWGGPTNLTSGRVNKGSNNQPPNDARRMAHDMMSAANAALVNDNTTVAQAIVNEINAQRQQPNLNFASRTQYPYNYYGDSHPLFSMSLWLTDLLMAYEICKSMGVSNSNVEAWFEAAGDLCDNTLHSDLSNVFPKRKQNDYSDRSSWVNNPQDIRRWRKADGTLIWQPRIPRYYNNRRSGLAGLCALSGVLTNNSALKSAFKLYAREWVMFGFRLSDGVAPDYERSTNGFPQLPYVYLVNGSQGVIFGADALARIGDTEAYDFVSSDGSGGSGGTASANKSFEDCVDSMLKWVIRTHPTVYSGTGSPSSVLDPPSSSVAGNSFYRIHSRNTSNGNEVVAEGPFLLAANYFNRSDWQDTILRIGTPTGFSATVQTSGPQTGWRSDWRSRFLYSLDANPYGS